MIASEFTVALQSQLRVKLAIYGIASELNCLLRGDAFFSANERSKGEGKGKEEEGKGRGGKGERERRKGKGYWK